MKMVNEEQRKRIIDKHRDSLTRFGYHPNALYWSNRKIQELRFRVLQEIGIESGDSLLDVGCGFADFKRWFEAEVGHISFTGIDLSPDILKVARRHHPDATLHCGLLTDFTFKERSFDWVIASGSLSENLHDGGEHGRNSVAAMFLLCRKGVAFNMLNARHRSNASAPDLQSYDPEEMLCYCQNLCSQVELIDDYLDNDFTIYMCRDRA